jgi:hypothetical protein
VSLARERQRTGRSSGWTSCRVWQLMHLSAALVAWSGTNIRLVVPQRVQIHSAVTGMPLI